MTMMSNHDYNKIKILHKLSCLSWFIEKHAIPDAQKDRDQRCIDAYQQLKAALDNHIEQLRQSLCSE
jgi:hypothetical protein